MGANKDIIIERLKKSIIVPVVRVSNPDDAFKVSEILIEEGISAVEVTMSISNADRVITELVKKYGEKIVVGAGTVLSRKDAELVAEAGAEFIVSPCFLTEVMDFCKENNIPVAPGTFSPTEIITAYNYGADIVKVFPASSAGGPKYIKSVKSVFPHIDLMPTGGVNAKTIQDYLNAGASLVGVGSDIVNNKLVKENRFDEIRQRTREIVSLVGTEGK